MAKRAEEIFRITAGGGAEVDRELIAESTAIALRRAVPQTMLVR